MTFVIYVNNGEKESGYLGLRVGAARKPILTPWQTEARRFDSFQQATQHIKSQGWIDDTGCRPGEIRAYVAHYTGLHSAEWAPGPCKVLLAGSPAVELAQKGHRPLYVRTLRGDLAEVPESNLATTLARAAKMDAYARWIYCVYIEGPCSNCDGEGRLEPGGCPVCFKVGRVQEDSAS